MALGDVKVSSKEVMHHSWDIHTHLSCWGHEGEGIRPRVLGAPKNRQQDGGGVGQESFSGHQCNTNSREWGVWKHRTSPLSALTPSHMTRFEQVKRHLQMACLFRQIYRRCPVSSPRRLPAVIPICGQMMVTSFGRPTSGISSGKCIPKESVQPGKILS